MSKKLEEQTRQLKKENMANRVLIKARKKLIEQNTQLRQEIQELKKTHTKSEKKVTLVLPRGSSSSEAEEVEE